MDVPLQIRFHKIEPSAAVEANIRKHVEKLERYCPDIVSCRVTVGAPHKHHHQGNIFHVTVDVRTPAGELVANRSPERHHAHEDAYVAIRDAFNAVRRQLKQQTNEKRGRVKTHDAPPHGKITEIYRSDDFGRITDSYGREIYFHRNSVVNADFDELELETDVRFVEASGDEGPQASSVYLLGKHHIVG